MIYLASPYSHPDPAVRDQRYLAACRATVRLLLAGYTTFSPIVHGHALADFSLPMDWKFWAQHDQQYLRRCNELIVLALPGWDESEGVQAEVALAQRLGKVVRYYPESSLPGRDVCATSRFGPNLGPSGDLVSRRDVAQLAPVERKDHP